MHLIQVGIECESIEDQSWGVGRIVKKLLEEISKRPELQKEFKFFLYFKSKIPDLPFLANPIFVKKIVRIPLLLPSFSIYYYLLLPFKLYFERLDLMYFPNYMLPIIFRGKSLVTLTEDIYYEFRQGTLPFRYRLAYKIFAGWAAKHATKITVLSESSKKEVTRLFKIKPDRVVINQLGVDVVNQLGVDKIPQTVSLHSDTIVSECKLEFNPRMENYVLYVGQAFPRRHLRETMFAFEMIAPRFPDLKLIAVGKDKYNPPIIEELVKKINSRLGRNVIIYKDYIPESGLAVLYANAKLLVYISSKEAFGLPPLEALAHGTAPIVANSAVTREIFGDAAFFVESPNNSDSIAAALTEALTNQPKREEILKSAGRILEKYSWQKHTDRFLEIIRKIKKPHPNRYR